MAKRWEDIKPRTEKGMTDRYIFRKDKWLYLSGWDIVAKHLREVPAVYVIYLDGELSYIGQSNTPRFRFRQHRFMSGSDNLYETPWGIFSDMYAKVKFPSKYGEEAMIEKRLIARLKPRFNKYKYKRKAEYAL